MLDNNFCLKIIDFGYASHPNLDGLHRNYVGTDQFLIFHFKILL